MTVSAKVCLFPHMERVSYSILWGFGADWQPADCKYNIDIEIQIRRQTQMRMKIQLITMFVFVFIVVFDSRLVFEEKSSGIGDPAEQQAPTNQI